MTRRRVLIAVHQLDLGGSQTNAVDLAIGALDRGHDVLVAGPEGPLAQRLHDRGVPFAHVPLQAMAHARAGYRELLRVSRSFRPDLVHAYELIPGLLAYAGPHLRDGVPMTVTINSMAVPSFMPASIPMQVCNPVIAHAARTRRDRVGVLEIPTDTTGQYPGFDGGQEFREALGVGSDEVLVVAVSRFARVLKQQGLETAIRVAGRVADRPVRLVLVGDGPAMPELRALAARTNAAAGRPVVVLTGALDDPKPAYAAADIVIGMGGSLLRAMAFGKPCIVQGERGFFRALDPTSARRFRWHGFYGVGDDPGDGTTGRGDDQLEQELVRLLDDVVLRAENAAFALALVRQCYGLDDAVDQQLDWYETVLAAPTRPGAVEPVRTVCAVGSWVAGRAVRKLRGIDMDDHFNSTAVIAAGVRAEIPGWYRPEPVRVPGPAPSHDERGLPA
jgi:glycosyltransferase involved in cell wall biosynthesis